ncbi:Crp/Fnr family transcriptional regulator [Rhizobiaceae bacterium CRRU44]|uniref:Crp/Fnr family transcriptional regulator n=1 Tax=Ferranicluibacter rubi TaxID=2715133 RepID=A0AA43ZIN2_9HYPH|nr:Crp/Fnr family transcriptional regulator [Ferranicluibacter rubi]NHT78580.1 Crp/Fnr family transcriptional regulator [Ferranicluibacter rubi]
MQDIKRADVRNRLLGALGTQAFELLQPGMERIDLPLRTVLVESDQPTSHIFFIESGLASIVARTVDDEAIEVGHIGWEGLCGTHRLLRLETTPNRTFMQIDGSAITVPVELVYRLIDEDAAARDLFFHYIHTCELQLAHSALANGRYNMSERLSRWLLMCHDRIRDDDMALTHEFLSLMLGVRRSGVTDHLHILEGMHAIKATRGRIRIRDRAKLEEIAGGCYGAPEREYDRLIGSR